MHLIKAKRLAWTLSLKDPQQGLLLLPIHTRTMSKSRRGNDKPWSQPLLWYMLSDTRLSCHWKKIYFFLNWGGTGTENWCPHSLSPLPRSGSGAGRGSLTKVILSHCIPLKVTIAFLCASSTSKRGQKWVGLPKQDFSPSWQWQCP